MDDLRTHEVGYHELGYLEKTNGLVVALIVLFSVLATLLVVRPHKPSPFSAGSGYGTGYGSDSVMLGASPRGGASR
jgi:hypothetical protein